MREFVWYLVVILTPAVVLMTGVGVVVAWKVIYGLLEARRGKAQKQWPEFCATCQSDLNPIWKIARPNGHRLWYECQCGQVRYATDTFDDQPEVVVWDENLNRVTDQYRPERMIRVPRRKQQ